MRGSTVLGCAGIPTLSSSTCILLTRRVPCVFTSSSLLLLELLRPSVDLEAVGQPAAVVPRECPVDDRPRLVVFALDEGLDGAGIGLDAALVDVVRDLDAAGAAGQDEERDGAG